MNAAQIRGAERTGLLADQRQATCGGPRARGADAPGVGYVVRLSALLVVCISVRCVVVAQTSTRAGAPARAELIEYALRTARDELAAPHVRAAAIGALGMCPLTAEIEEFLDRTAAQGPPELRGQAIYALWRWKPDAARELADKWVDQAGRKMLQEIRKIGGTKPGHGSFALALLAASPRRSVAIVKEWLDSGDGNAQSLVLPLLLDPCARDLCHGGVLKRVRTLTNSERLGPWARMILAAHGDTGAALWLKKRLKNPDIRFVMLSSGGPEWLKQLSGSLTPDEVLAAAAADWKSGDPVHRMAVARFAARLGRERGFAVLEELAEPLLRADKWDSTALAALGFLAENPRAEGAELGTRMFRTTELDEARVLAANVVLAWDCHGEGGKASGATSAPTKRR